MVKKPYDFTAFTSVRKNCTVCNLNYHLEPSFYFGSMFIAYALGVAVMVTVIVLNHLFFTHFSFLRAFWTILVTLVFLAPYLNGLSKIIWANFFFGYDPNWEEKKIKAHAQGPSPPTAQKDRDHSGAN
ncbi:MAG: DUF983 domain-containing protein [Flavobacteriaceae bacterium]